MANRKKNSSKTKRSTSKNKQPKRSLLAKFWGVLKWLLLIGFIVFAVYVIRLDREVVSKFSGQKWELPTHVYARPLELYEGMQLDPAHLVREAKGLGYVERKSGVGSVFKEGSTVYLNTRGFTFSDGKEPAHNLKIRFSGKRIKSVSATKGSEGVSVVRLEPLMIGGIYPDHNEDRLLVKYEEVPPKLVKALLAVEDRNYFKHFGVSIRGTVRAILNNILNRGGRMQGGSTLTQQLVKNFYLSSERTLKRKAVEAIMAVLLEVRYSKEEILEAYMNEINFGQNGQKAIHGFGLASYYFFNKPLASLNDQEIALLVGVINGPSKYNPIKNPNDSKARRNEVIGDMLSQGVLTEKEAKAARESNIVLGDREAGLSRVYPAYLDLVRRQLKTDYKEKDLKTEGLKIFTSFDPQVQWQTEAAIKKQMATMEKRIKKGDREKFQAAAVVISPETGDVVAVAGDKKATFAGFNRALDSKRPIGSLVKPAIYLTALEQSDKYTLGSVLSDTKVSIQAGGKRWRPQNYDKREHGDVMLYRSLAKSYNLSTVHLGLDLGVDQVIKTMHKLGAQSEIPEVPAMLLGAVDMAPYEVAQMYQTIAGGGFFTPLRVIRNVLDAEGNALKRYPLKVEKRFDKEPIYLIQFAMHEVMRDGTAKYAYRFISKNIEMAGKTGTSNDKRDSWFAGFSGNRLAVVWVGRDDNKPMPFSGGTGALPIWTSIMKGLELRSIDLTEPEDVESFYIDSTNGLLATQACGSAIILPFMKESEPEEQSSCGQYIPPSESQIAREQLAEDEAALQEQLNRETAPQEEKKSETNVLDWASDVLQ